jgi:hypothetical protein
MLLCLGTCAVSEWRRSQVKGKNNYTETGQIVHMAIIAHSIANDCRLPMAETWQDDIRPYYTKLREKYLAKMRQQGFEIVIPAPGEPLTCVWVDNDTLRTEKKTSFFYNEAFSGLILSDSWQTDTAKNINEPILFEFPGACYNGHGSPKTRIMHPDFKNSGFLDGLGPDYRPYYDCSHHGCTTFGGSREFDVINSMKPEDGL